MPVELVEPPWVINGDVAHTNQTGAVETEFVPAFIVQRRAEDTQNFDSQSLHRNHGSTARVERVPATGASYYLDEIYDAFDTDVGTTLEGLFPCNLWL